MKDASIDRLIRATVVIGNLVFLILIVALNYFNRLAIDDFHFLSLAREHGIIEATRLEHMEWSGRWASVLLVQIILSFQDTGLNLFFYGVTMLFLFIVAVYRITDRLSALLNWPRSGSWLKLNAAIFIVSGFFYASISIDQTWFWLCASATYLGSMVMLLLGISAILPSQKNFLDPVLCALAFIYVGGSCEPLAVFVLLVLLMIITYGFIKKSFPLKRLLIAFVACLVAFLIMYMGEGNRVRESFFEKIGIWRAAMINVKTTGMIIVYKLAQILPFLLLFTMPALAIARSRSEKVIPQTVVVWRITAIIVLYLGALYVYQFPITFATQDIGADRALFTATLLGLIAGSLIFHSLAKVRVGSDQQVGTLTLISVVAVAVINIYTLIDQLKVLPQYAKAHDQRIEFLKSRKDDPGIVQVEPLPASGLLFSAEISMDPGHFANRHLKSGLGLKADIMLRSEDR